MPRAVLLVCCCAAALLAVMAAAAPAVAAQHEAPRAAVLVVDASADMNRVVGPFESSRAYTLLSEVKNALNRGFGALPPEEAVYGLRLLGHRLPADDPGACADTEAVVPVGPVDPFTPTEEVERYRATGVRPLAAALRAAYDDLPPSATGTVVLVAGGGDTCGGDPCAVAQELAATRPGVAVDVLGHAFPDQAAQGQLECVAAATGGLYVDAVDGDALGFWLEELLSRALRRPPGDPVVEEGALASPLAPVLASGSYRTTVAGGAPRWFAFEVAEGQSATVDVVQPPVPGLRGIGADLDARLLLNEVQADSAFGHADGDGETFQLRDPLGRPGRYLVEVAVDRGEFPITLRVDVAGLESASSASSAPVDAATPAPSPTPVPRSEDGGGLPGWLWVMLFAALVLVVGVVRARRRPRHTGD
jgi:Ca-activated chloride channel family protein